MTNHITFFFTGNNVEFANALCRAGVEAYAIEGNKVVLDKDQLDRIPIRDLPVWVWRNLDDINNPLKARPCIVGEWPGTNEKDKYGTCLVLDRDVVGFDYHYTDDLARACKWAKRQVTYYRGVDKSDFDYLPIVAVCVVKNGEIIATEWV